MSIRTSFRAWWKSLTKSDRDSVSLRMLGWPSLEKLGEVGLTGPEFHSRYIATTPANPPEKMYEYTARVLRKFYADFPEAKR